jgi:FtsP/CotA-like multicopper oxidase with cupredoxin domain
MRNARKTRARLGAALALATAMSLAGMSSVGAVLLADGAGSGSPANEQEAPKAAPAAQKVTAPAATVTIDLCAMTGTSTMPDNTVVPIWGFALDAGTPGSCDSGEAASLPGPVLTVAEGDVVTVNLTDHDVPGDVSLEFIGQDVAVSGNAYTFTAKPGTFLYQSGSYVTAQVPMGLYGALIVSSSTAGTAYGTGSDFDVEAAMVLSEVDASFNEDPTAENLLDYDPDYWLINGKSYPDASLNPIASATAGDQVLLRYVNAGLKHHTMMVLGAHQRLIARDADPLTYPYDLVSEIIPSGATADGLVTTTAAGSLPVLSANLDLVSGSGSGAAFGGMLAFIQVT